MAQQATETQAATRSFDPLSRAELMLLLLVAIWGFNFSIIKRSLEEMAPLAFAGVRFLLAAATLVIIQKLRGEPIWVQRRDSLQVAGLGLLGYMLYQLFFSHGVALTTADNSALILATGPALTALFCALLGLERLRWLGWLGIATSFAGVMVIILGSHGRIGQGNLGGDLLILAGACVWALYTALVRPLLERYPPSVLTAALTIAGAVGLLLASLPECLRQDWRAVSLPAWLGLAYSAVLAAAVANWIWNTGVQRVGSARTAMYSNLTPLIGAIAAWLLLGERVTWLHLIGGTVILAGISLTRRDRRQGIEVLARRHEWNRGNSRN